ncbi:unnamed protein product [Coffea canephora]|uniref:FAD-binding domain-containing protein n=1 Tax=Coffea canephora TaxID=49390 RepID=A0A068USX6_COFCA|nr:unnamed protein product [Coffea canephora]
MDAVREEEEHEVVIVGGGIGGLATALALHRKGLRSVVYERSESLRAEGSAITILRNGWRALDQLGVGDVLRDKAILVQGGQGIWVDEGNQQQPIPIPGGEARCLKRSDLIKALADALPPETVRFGYKVVAVTMDPENMFPTLTLNNGSSIRAKVLIGCDGSNSVVADFLGIKPTRLFALCSVRGLTSYPNGHVFSPELVRIKRDRVMVGRIPVDNNLVYWFVSVPLSWLDRKFPDDPELIRKLTTKITEGFPSDAVEMIEGSDLDSLSITHLRYHAPWEMLVGRFRRGPITVAGDAMHAMGPFLGQGGSAALEDAVVLARNLGRKIASLSPYERGKEIMTDKIGQAFDQYVEERRMRMVRLATQAYLTGLILGSPPMSITKFIAVIIMAILFRDRNEHAKFDCGNL